MLHWLPWTLLTRTRRLMAAGAAAVVMLLCNAVVAAWDGVSPELEYSVKAAFIYKFLAFVEWPASSDRAGERPLVIGVVAADDVADELEDIVAGRSVGGKPIAVRRLPRIEAPQDVDLLFIGRATEHQLRGLASSAQRHSSLVVCESQQRLPPGCAINFVLVDGRVRFEVSQRAAEARGLRLSSRLLSVAFRVDGKRP